MKLIEIENLFPKNLSQRSTLVFVCGCLLILPVLARAATPQEILNSYQVQSGKVASASHGQRLFTAKQGHEMTCSACHGNPPVKTGQHASTGKTIAPLAPAANSERFRDANKVEKWFRRNCNDVLGRECTTSEKADVLSWLMTLKP